MAESDQPRPATIFFSDLVGFSRFTERVGDRVAGDVVNRLLALQRQVIERDEAGRVLEMRGDSVFAVFDSPSAAMSRALEVQRRLKQWRDDEQTAVPAVRIGLHFGEMRVDGDQPQVISRHVNRAHRVMELAGGDQVLASGAVVDAGRDYIDGVPYPHLAIEPRGVHELKGVGETAVFELADRRVREPAVSLPPPGSQHTTSGRSSAGMSNLPTWLRPHAVEAVPLDYRRVAIQVATIVAWAALGGWLTSVHESDLLGMVCLVATVALSAALIPLHFRVRLSAATLSLQGQLLLLWGVFTTAAVTERTMRTGRLAEHGLEVCFLIWAVIAIAAQLLLWAMVWRWRPRPGAAGPWCPGCGYSLLGLTEPRCPECGRKFDLQELGITEADLRPG